MLDIDEGQSEGGLRALRVRFLLTGSTTEIEWDESDEEATAFIDEEALTKADDWEIDRELMGRSKWDAVPDT